MHLPIFPTPLRTGAGFKPMHFEEIMADKEKVGFFEVHAENYMGDGGAPHAMLQRLRLDYPLFVHGVGLSIGGEQGLDKKHLTRLKKVVDRCEPQIVSEHLAWSTHDTTYYNDLLPVPYTEEVLDRVVRHVDELQTALGRKVLIENPSTYVRFDASTMAETEFLWSLAIRSGCGLLLDINNVEISATNHGYAPENYLAGFPLELVGEIHLAGHATETDGDGLPLLIDSHDRTVSDTVWPLFEQVVAARGGIPTLIEWDNDVPAWPVLKAEAERADAVMDRLRAPSSARLLDYAH